MPRSHYIFHRIILGSLVIILSFPACKKLIEVPSPENQVDASTVFSGAQGATTAMLGVYISIMDNSRSLLNGGMSLYGGMSSDEFFRTSVFATEDAFTLNALSDLNPLCSTLYEASYNWIYDCNNILEQVAPSSGIDVSTKKQLTGEAEFIRALNYFYLVNLYGDVPLVTSTDYTANSTLPRTPSAQVYQRIVGDLREAQNDLPSSSVGSYNDRTRPNQAAANALLARTYLYEGQWSLAEQEASKLLNNYTDYQLETDLDHVFLSTSRETIWQLQPVHATGNTAEARLFIPGNTMRPVYALTDWLLNSFEPGDQRLKHWTAGSTAGTHYIYPFKYKQTTDTAVYPEYNIVLRLAEQYLIRAEARVQENKLSGAIADLNTIRSRAGLPPTTATDPAGLLMAIQHERQAEFFAEWGHRWLDLKRTGQANTLLGMEKPGWKPDAALYPIPFSELSYNPNMVQNPGY